MIGLKKPEDFSVGEGQKKAIVGGSRAGTEAPLAPGRNGVPVNQPDNDDQLSYFINVLMEINLVFGVPSVDQSRSLYLGVCPLFQAAQQKLLHLLFVLKDFPHKKALDVPFLILLVGSFLHILVGSLFVFLDNPTFIPGAFLLDLFNLLCLFLAYLLCAQILALNLLKLV